MLNPSPERPRDTEEPPDAVLIARCLGNEKNAWQSVVARHGPRAYSIARRSGLSDEDAADVVQAVFLALLENLARLRRPEQLGAWVNTTAKRVSWRRAARSRALNLDAIPGEIHDSTSGPDEQALQAEERRWIATAFYRLDRRSALLLWLLFCDPRNLSYDQVASELRVPKGSVGPLRARALAKLKALFDDGARPSPRTA